MQAIRLLFGISTEKYVFILVEINSKRTRLFSVIAMLAVIVTHAEKIFVSENYIIK